MIKKFENYNVRGPFIDHIQMSDKIVNYMKNTLSEYTDNIFQISFRLERDLCYIEGLNEKNPNGLYIYISEDIMLGDQHVGTYGTGIIIWTSSDNMIQYYLTPWVGEEIFKVYLEYDEPTLETTFENFIEYIKKGLFIK